MHSHKQQIAGTDISCYITGTILYLAAVSQHVGPGFPGSAPGLCFWPQGNPGGHSWPEPDAAESLLPQLGLNQTPPDS